MPQSCNFEHGSRAALGGTQVTIGRNQGTEVGKKRHWARAYRVPRMPVRDCSHPFWQGPRTTFSTTYWTLLGSTFYSPSLPDRNPALSWRRQSRSWRERISKTRSFRRKPVNRSVAPGRRIAAPSGGESTARRSRIVSTSPGHTPGTRSAKRTAPGTGATRCPHRKPPPCRATGAQGSVPSPGFRIPVGPLLLRRSGAKTYTVLGLKGKGLAKHDLVPDPRPRSRPSQDPTSGGGRGVFGGRPRSFLRAFAVLPATVILSDLPIPTEPSGNPSGCPARSRSREHGVLNRWQRRQDLGFSDRACGV
jgi:hypothetical protein